MRHSSKKGCKASVSNRERLVCAFAVLTLIFTAWSFGGYENWALHLLFIGGVGTFFMAIVPMPKSWNGASQECGGIKNFKRLLLKPFFFASLSFMGYSFIQYFNPSIIQVSGVNSWWVESISHPLGKFLPSSVMADYNTMNALRVIAIHASAISLVCGIIVGIKTAKSALIALWAFVFSGGVMGFVAILQYLSGSKKLLWSVEVLNSSPWGTFAYRNQAAAFLILVIIISGALYFFYERKAFEQSLKGGAHMFLGLIILVLLGSIWLSLSRGGLF